VKGQTIADLGAGNQPLDMVPYKKDGKNYILVANPAFGLLKVQADHLETYATIELAHQNPGTAGMPFDKITTVTNVKQLSQLDSANACRPHRQLRRRNRPSLPARPSDR